MALGSACAHLLLSHVTMVLTQPVDCHHTVLVLEALQLRLVRPLIERTSVCDIVSIIGILFDLVGLVLLNDSIRLRRGLMQVVVVVVESFEVVDELVLVLLSAQVRHKVLDQLQDAKDGGAVFRARTILALASDACRVRIILRTRNVSLACVLEEELLAALVVDTLEGLGVCRRVKVYPKDVLVVACTSQAWHLLNARLIQTPQGVVQVHHLVAVAKLGLSLGLLHDDLQVGNLH